MISFSGFHYFFSDNKIVFKFNEYIIIGKNKTKHLENKFYEMSITIADCYSIIAIWKYLSAQNAIVQKTI